jgi:hypothetical protein
MQIRVRIEPYWKPPLKQELPRLSALIAEVDYDLIEDEPSLLTLIEHLGRVHDSPGADPRLKEVLASRAPGLFELRRKVEELIGEWRLGEADRVLYQIEDVFGEMDRDLA